MNQIYRTIWNAARGLWQVASELGSQYGKSRSRSVSQLVAGSLLIVSLGAQAELPSDGQIVAGSGSIGQNGAAMTVHQSSQNMAINWKSFSIGQDNSVRFVQPSASSAVLNRVTGNQVSEIRGKLSANGKVFLVNPNGVLFSQTAKVDVGALVASTLDISPSDFMAGNYQFSGTASNAVINQGNIVAAEGGFVAMIAAKIINTGAITTPKGSTLMGAGSTVTLDLGGPVKLEVNQATLETYIEQGGAIKADGGFVYLTAKAADALTSSVINHTGLTQAQSLSTNDKGEIVLLGDMQSGQLKVAGTLDASAPNGGDGGFIETSAAKVQIADNTAVTTQAQSGKTGEWLIDPTDFNIDAGSATQTASGMGADTLSSNLDANNVTLTTSATDTGSELGDINVNAAVNWTSNTTLILNAHHDININAPITATGADAGLALNYGDSFNNSGTPAANTNYHVNAPVTLSGTNASFAVNGQGYTLLHNQADLDAAKDTSGNYYALGNDVTLTGTYSDSVLGNFSGTLAGLGHSVDSLVIEQTSTSSTKTVGFISRLTDGVVRDMGLRDIQVTNHSTSPNSRTGGLVGYQYLGGTISNSHASGAVTGTSNSYYVGGLVGDQSSGNISNSYASAAVSGGNFVGGLVGIQYQGTISNSYASGAVTGTGDGVGGLVGFQNSGGAISNSYYATTNVAGDPINNGDEYNGNGTAATYDELTKPATFSGWDPNIWTFPTQTGSAAAGYGIALPYLTQVTAQSDRTLFSSGLGTQASPYQITNWTQLQNINYNSDVLTNSYYFELADSLDASSAGYLSSWTPLGTVPNAFNGHFDGQYHILADLNTASSISNAGLFGMTAAGATIEKVGLTNAHIQGTTNVGGL